MTPTRRTLPGPRRPTTRPASKRERSGQPWHKRVVRPMVPPDPLIDVVEWMPTACGSCGTALAGSDPRPHSHQVAELPEVPPDVVEYRLHRLTCPCCRKATRAPLPPGVPTGAFGPRLLATITLPTGAYRFSKRQVRAALADLLGLFGLPPRKLATPPASWVSATATPSPSSGTAGRRSRSVSPRSTPPRRARISGAGPSWRPPTSPSARRSRSARRRLTATAGRSPKCFARRPVAQPRAGRPGHGVVVPRVRPRRRRAGPGRGRGEDGRSRALGSGRGRPGDG